MWGRYITYDYMGRLGRDYVGVFPAEDIDGNEVTLPQSVADESDLVLITDYNTYNTTVDYYGFANHPPSVSDAPNQRDGLNVGHLDGSVVWRAERDTVPTYQWRPNDWKRY